MSSSAAKVAEIFTAAGEAFSYLGNLTMQLHPLDSDYSSCNSSRAKWGEEEIEMLRNAVTRFGKDLKKISEQVKTKSVAQIKAALKKGLLEQNANKKHASTSTRSTSSGEPTAKRQKTTEPPIKQDLYPHFTADAAAQISKPATSSATSAPSAPLLLTAVTTPMQSADHNVDVVSVSHQSETGNEGVLPVDHVDIL